MRRLRAFFGFAVVSAALAGGWLWSNHTDTAGRPLLHKHVMDRRCRGGCVNFALMWILRGGPTSAQVAAGTLTASNNSSVTDTRASNKTCATSTGVTILGSNQPCVDPVGLNIEGASTNLALRSQDTTNAAWSRGGGTSAAAATTAPDGTLTGNSFTSDTSTGLHRIIDTSVSVTSGQKYTHSIYAKAGAWNFVSTTLTNGNAYAVFDLSQGVVSSTGLGGATGTIAAVGNGWYRVATTETAGSTSTFSPVVYFGDTALHAVPNTSFTGTAVLAAYVWGFQVENQPFVTSYIPTTSASVARAADDLAVTSALSANPGTWCVAATVVPLGSSWTATAGVLAAGTAAAANSWALSLTSSGKPTLSVYDATLAQKVFTATSAISAASHRLVACDASGALTIAVDGANVAGATTGAGTGVLASQPATLLLGETATSGTNPLWADMSSVCQATSSSGCN